MAIAFVGKFTGTQGNGTFNSGTLNTTGATLLVAFANPFRATPTMADNKGNTLALRGSSLGGGYYGVVFAFDSVNPAVGAGHYLIGHTIDYGSLLGGALSGTDASSFDKTAAGSTTNFSNAYLGTIIPTSANSLFISAVGAARYTTTWNAVSSPFTLQDHTTNPSFFYGSWASYIQTGGPTGENPTFTGSNHRVGMVNVIYKPASSGTNVNLTGVAATGAVGAFGPKLIALSGVSATGLAGILDADPRPGVVFLVGVSSTGQAGGFTPSISFSFTGVAGTGAAGSIKGSGADSLSGVFGTGAAGSFVPSIAFGFAGVAGSGSAGTLGGSGSGALAGVSATGAAGAIIGSVSFTLTGAQAAGQVGAFSFASDHTVALTGVNGAGFAGSFGSADQGSLIGVSASGLAAAFTGQIIVAPFGVFAAGHVGNFLLPHDANVSLDGLFATGLVGHFIVSIPSSLAIDHETVILAALRTTAVIAEPRRTMLIATPRKAIIS